MKILLALIFLLFNSTYTYSQSNEGAAKLFKEASSFYENGDIGEAITRFDLITKNYESSSDPNTQLIVAKSLTNKGDYLAAMMNSEEAIITINHFLTLFSKSNKNELQPLIAENLSNKVLAQSYISKADTIVTFEELNKRFGQSSISEIQKHVATGMYYKCSTLKYMSNEAIICYDSLIKKFGSSDEQNVQISVSNAFVDKGLALMLQKKYVDAVEVFDAVIKKYSKFKDGHLHTPIFMADVYREKALLKQSPF